MKQAIFLKLNKDLIQILILTLVRITGFLLIGFGFIAAYYGPLEIYVFYLFSEGGRFYYEGFGFGSLWFAYLVIQNIGYYLFAAVCIPLGIGHIKVYRWTLTLTQLFLWFWLGAGFLFAFNLISLLPQVFSLEIKQDILLTRLIIIGGFASFLLLILPTLSLVIYRSKKIKQVFVKYDQNTYWIEKYPFPLLALLLLLIIMIIVMHIAIFFQGLFPVFGILLQGRQSVYLISLCILILGILSAGIVLRKKWAWWSSLIFLSLLSLSSMVTFFRFNLYELILLMNLPAYEMEIIDQMTLVHDFHLAGLLTPPIIIALGLLIYSKRYFC